MVIRLIGAAPYIIMVLAEFGRIPRTWQNLAETADCHRKMADCRGKTADCRGKWQIAVVDHNLRQITVETGGCVCGYMRGCV